MRRPTNFVAASWLAKIKAQGGPVAQGGAIPRAEAQQAPAAGKTGLARALDARCLCFRAARRVKCWLERTGRT